MHQSVAPRSEGGLMSGQWSDMVRCTLKKDPFLAQQGLGWETRQPGSGWDPRPPRPWGLEEK